ncbi:MAG: flagellar biosynthesis protein FliC [Cellvibrionaceae bacterium]
MPLYINTNVQSLNSQRQLVKSGQDMTTAMERLSSGKRINKAGDDAAGLAIANRMTSQIRGLDQAVRNANDGISLVQTAEGALDETTSILQRMRELSIQSANGIYSDADRATLDAEVQQLKEEIDRIADTTTFNGQALLDGSLADVELQVGAEAYETINLEVPGTNIDTLGAGVGGDVVGFEMAIDTISTLSFANLRINSQQVGQLSTLSFAQISTGGLQGILDEMNDNVSNVNFDAIIDFTATGAGTGILRGTNVLTISAQMMDGTLQTFNISDTGSMEELAEKISSASGGILKGGVSDEGKLTIESTDVAQITLDSGNSVFQAVGIASTTGVGDVESARMLLTSKDSNDITIDGGSSAAGISSTALVEALGLNSRFEGGDISGVSGTAVALLTEGDLEINDVTIGAFSAASIAAAVIAINMESEETGVVAAQNSTTGVLTLNSVDGSEIKVDFADSVDSSASLNGIRETNNSTASGKNIGNVDIGTASGAQAAIDIIDSALEQINASRAQMGAVNNRLNHTISNLMNVSENTAAARSRIMDADFASETSKLSRAQVLQQASQAMLAQANSAPQQVLQLLQ